MAAADKRLVIDGDPDVEVHLRRSPRARRLSLRVSQLDGKVTLSLPARLDEKVAREFLLEKADWVRAHLDARPDHYRADIGARVPVLGHDTIICAGPGKRPVLRDDMLYVAASRAAPPQVAAFLKTLAREQFAVACDGYAKQIGKTIGRLTIRDTRSRWGSCTSDGNLMFSWRLAMAPMEVLNYVAAHEVAHLVEMNHGPAFWQLVATLDADFKRHRRWLRDNGADLHRVRFES